MPTSRTAVGLDGDTLSRLPHAQPILIRADRSADVSRLVELWDLCRDAGFHEVRIATMTE